VNALLTRVVLAIMAASALSIGVWAELFPRSFYDDFPGMGRTWVAVDGPYNEHLIRDVGGLQLALGVLTVAAAITLGRGLVITACAATLVFAVPHLWYHWHHLDPFDTSDQVGIIVSLSLGVVAPIAVLLLGLKRDDSGASRADSVVQPVRGARA
jgi:hypothetical protein